MPKLKGQINVKAQMPIRVGVQSLETNRPSARYGFEASGFFFGYLSLGFDLAFGF
jgi:hypothetical protein